MQHILIIYPPLLPEGESSNYRPPYLDHFDNPPAAKNKKETSIMPSTSVPTQNHSGEDNVRISNSDKNNLPGADAQEKAQEALDKRLLEQISGGQIQEGPVRPPNHSSATQGKVNTVPNMGGTGDQGQGKFQRCIAEGDLDFVSMYSRDIFGGRSAGFYKWGGELSSKPKSLILMISLCNYSSNSYLLMN